MVANMTTVHNIYHQWIWEQYEVINDKNVAVQSFIECLNAITKCASYKRSSTHNQTIVTKYQHQFNEMLRSPSKHVPFELNEAKLCLNTLNLDELKLIIISLLYVCYELLETKPLKSFEGELNVETILSKLDDLILIA